MSRGCRTWTEPPRQPRSSRHGGQRHNATAMNLIGDGPLVTVCSVPFVAVILLWLLVTNVYILRNASGYNVLGSKPVASKPSSEHPTRLSNVSLEDRPPILQEEVDDDHPIRHLMHYADAQFRQYDQDRSRTFKETVEKYRRTHGRHPPPRFKEVIQSHGLAPGSLLLIFSLVV